MHIHGIYEKFGRIRQLLTCQGTLLGLDRVDGNKRHRGAMKLLLAEVLDVLIIS